MLDIRFIRENPDIVLKNLEKRRDTEKIGWLDELIEKDKEYKSLKQRAEDLRHRRNIITQQINDAKKRNEDVSGLIEEAKNLPAEIARIENDVNELNERIRFYLMRIPNILHDSVPYGESEEDNLVVKSWGRKRKFKFEPKSHVDLLAEKDWGDTERAGVVSGARFYYLKRELVLLEQAILRFALDILYKKGYVLIEPPFMLRRKPYEGVTDLSDFEDVMYKIENEDLYLIATSEHPIAAMHMDESFNADQLPLKYAGISACFRKEAGAHGKDTKGIFRVHQFNKVEQFIFCRPEQSWELHEELIKNAEEIFQALKIPYRIVNICTAEIGLVAAKKYDLEAWMPVQQEYREMVSCSNCTAYQSVRLGIKYIKGEEKEFVHTLNSTAVATPRAIVAIMENHQQADGSIKLPGALRKYMSGMREIGARGK